MKFDKGFYVYKWVYDNEIVYIGQTIHPLVRINQESKVEKFQPYLDSEIFVTQVMNRTEMDGLEKLLINKYQPILNMKDTSDVSSNIPIDDEKLLWINIQKASEDEKVQRTIVKKESNMKHLNILQERLEYFAFIIDSAICMQRENISSQFININHLKSVDDRLQNSGRLVYSLERSIEQLENCYNNELGQDFSIKFPQDYSLFSHIEIIYYDNESDYLFIELYFEYEDENGEILHAPVYFDNSIGDIKSLEFLEEIYDYSLQIHEVAEYKIKLLQDEITELKSQVSLVA